MGGYVYEVIRCNGPLVSWQMEQSILLFIHYVNVTDVISLGQMLWPLLFIVVIMVHGTIMKPCGCQGITRPWYCGLLFEFEFW